MGDGNFNQNKKKTVYLFVITCTASLAFLTGYTLNRVLSQHGRPTAASRKLTNFRRNVHKDEKRNFDYCDQSWSDLDYEYKQFHDDAVKKVSAKSIDDIHKNLTLHPHMAGSQRNNELGDIIAETWKSYGMKVYKKTYEVLLSEANSPAVLQLLNQNGSVEYEPKMVEEAFFKEENSTDTVPPFNAYSLPADITAEYVYVNGGTYLDYKELQDLHIQLQGKIFVTHYSSISRSEKAKLAFEHGAIGLIIFPFEPDVTDPGQKPYPNSWGLPSSGMPRGTLLAIKGDPLTPEWPAKAGMFRIPEDDAQIPRIPVQPVSYSIAEKILSDMDGIAAPMGWVKPVGENTRITASRRIRLKTDTPRVMKNVTNIIGVLKGDKEPDRIVVMGNHRDSWVYGGGDPSSGTACLMEVTRVLDSLYNGNSDWKPRRTIVFASWDAEEYGLVGSVEWLQEYSTVMQAKTVAYLNVDIGVSGNFSFRARGTPSLADSIYEVTKDIDDPDKDEIGKNETFQKVFDRWKSKLPNPNIEGLPHISPPRSGSDFQGFYTMFGIPVLDVRYEYDQALKFHNYPTYHTIYDNYQYFKRFIDPDKRYHKTLTQVLLRQLLKLSDDVILPFNLTRYADAILTDYVAMEMTHAEHLVRHGMSLERIKETLLELKKATIKFHKKADSIHKNDVYSVRRINDQLMWFERALLVPEGVLGHYGFRHAIYSPIIKNLFSRNTFPGLAEMMYEIEINKQDKWEELKIQISILVNCLENAIKIISDDEL